jgi:hypothetical protein
VEHLSWSVTGGYRNLKIIFQKLTLSPPFEKKEVARDKVQGSRIKDQGQRLKVNYWRVFSPLDNGFSPCLKSYVPNDQPEIKKL